MSRFEGFDATTEVPVMRDRLDTFKQLLDSQDPGADTLLEEMFSSAVSETLEKLQQLIEVYVDSPDQLAVLMPIYDEVSTVAELYEAHRRRGTARSFLKKSLDFTDQIPTAKSTSSSSASTTTSEAASPVPKPAVKVDADGWQEWPLLQLTPPPVKPATASPGTPPTATAFVPASTPPVVPVAAAAAPKSPAPPSPQIPLPDITCPVNPLPLSPSPSPSLTRHLSQICMDDVKGDQCLRIACGHQYCLDCLDDYLGVRVKEGKVLDVKCPNPTCTETLSYSDVSPSSISPSLPPSLFFHCL